MVEQREHGESKGSSGTSMERQRIPEVSVLPSKSTPEAGWLGGRRKSVIVERRIVGIRPVEVNCPTVDVGCEDGSGGMDRPRVKVRVTKEGMVRSTASTQSRRLPAEAESKRVLDGDLQKWHEDLLERLSQRDS